MFSVTGQDIPCETNAASRKIKRKRPVLIQNGFFLYHLKILRDEAVEKNWNSRRTYIKAVKALERYPLLLETAQSCQILEGFGAKTCEYLDKKLSDLAATLNVSVQEALQLGNEEFSTATKAKILKPSKPDLQAVSVTQSTLCNSNADALPSSLTQVTPQKCKKNRNSSQTGYVPRLFSGPHALMRALYEDILSGGSGLNKVALINAAQPYCETSFLQSESPGSYYSSWSSMSTLTIKGFVLKTGNPAFYSLTEPGRTLARKMFASNDVDSCQSQKSKNISMPVSNSPPSTSHVNSNSLGKYHSISESEDTEDEPDNSDTVDTLFNTATADVQVSERSSLPLKCSVCSYKFEFSYLDDSHNLVDTKDAAGVVIDESLDGLGFLVSCRYSDLLASSVTYTLDIAALGKTDPGFVAAFMKDSDLPEFSFGKCTHLKQTESSQIGLVRAESTNDNNSNASTSIALSQQPLPGLDHISQPLLRQVSSSSSSWKSTALTDSSSQESASSLQESPNLLYTIEPNQFEVIIRIDNREHYGLGAVKQMLIPGLNSNGIRFDLRSLHVSDFLWIAKCSKTGREAVLGVLVERKRLDDLASSITDGRFREQKFRLRRCGQFQIVILVEDCGGKSQHIRVPLDTLRQTLANSQLIDNCVLHRCRNSHDTVTYLSLMTERLKEFYLDKRIEVYDSSHPTHSSELPAIFQPSELSAKSVRLVDFEYFNRQAVKSKKLSAREMFAKHLMQLQGVTMEKAAAIVNRYPTVQSLLSAYEIEINREEQEKMLSKIVYCKIPEKTIGDIISVQVYRNFH